MHDDRQTVNLSCDVKRWAVTHAANYGRNLVPYDHVKTRDISVEKCKVDAFEPLTILKMC